MAKWRPGIIFVGMETSGRFRRRFQAMGFETYSCDLLPSEDGGEEMEFSDDGLPLGRHLVGDVFETLDNLWANDLWPSLGIFHPDCTHVTGSAAWAFKDPDFARYPGVGYHQRVKPETLTGAARREAREKSRDQFRALVALPIHRKAIENPIGGFSAVAKVSQIVQPYQFGDDASKATCFWFFDKGGNPAPDMKLPIDAALYVEPTLRANGKRYWSNQTDTGQNRLSPGENRWKDRSRTYDGIAEAATAHWARLLELEYDL